MFYRLTDLIATRTEKKNEREEEGKLEKLVMQGHTEYVKGSILIYVSVLLCTTYYNKSIYLIYETQDNHVFVQYWCKQSCLRTIT